MRISDWSSDVCSSDLERRERYWQPYHDALGEALDRLRGVHARVLLWEAHSIRGECPFLFEGRLPDFNIGTADGRSCDPQRQARIEACLAAQSAYAWVANGRSEERRVGKECVSR